MTVCSIARGAGLTDCHSAGRKGTWSLPRSRVLLLCSFPGSIAEGGLRSPFPHVYIVIHCARLTSTYVTYCSILCYGEG